MLFFILIEVRILRSLGSIIPVDIATYLGIDFISGGVVVCGFLYQKLFPQIVNPQAMAMLSASQSNDVAQYIKVCHEFTTT